ncbi:MAG: 50S ribosomal protein L1 [Patescibacteria group bacterium]|jgi:large subunit ribosomal protein L1
MPKQGKRHAANTAKVEKRLYTPTEAIALLKELRHAKFSESVELHLRLGIDPKQGEQQVRGTLTLPHGTGKTKKVAVFAEGEAEMEAKKAGADIVGGKELIDKIRTSGKCEFDVAVATPDMMVNLAGIAKILGPRGLMPSPKNETVTKNVAKAVAELRKGKITFKNDDTSNLHQAIGKIDQPANEILENLQTLLDAVRRAKPASSKGVYIKGATLTTTMGPGLQLSLS